MVFKAPEGRRDRVHITAGSLLKIPLLLHKQRNLFKICIISLDGGSEHNLCQSFQCTLCSCFCGVMGGGFSLLGERELRVDSEF